jgi:hypothetical protein
MKLGRYADTGDGYNNLRGVILPRLEELGISVEMLAQRIQASGFHITRATIYYWLSDKRRPLPELARVTARALGRPAEMLLSAYTPRNRTPWDRVVGEKATGPAHAGVTVAGHR